MTEALVYGLNWFWLHLKQKRKLINFGYIIFLNFFRFRKTLKCKETIHEVCQICDNKIR